MSDDARAYWNDEAGPRWARVQEQVDRIMAPVTERLLAAAAPVPGERAIDIGCAGGATLRELAARVGPRGSVLGVDISEPLLAVARERAGEGVELALGDAQVYPFEPAAADLALSRFGVMFFADTVAAFTNIGRALVSGGRLAFACWTAPERNAWMTTPMIAAGDLVEWPQMTDMPAGDQPGPFRLGDRDRTAAQLAEAGFADIDIDIAELELEHRGAVDEIVSFYLEVGPLAQAIEPLAPTGRERVLERVRADLERRHDGEKIAFGAALWIATARR